MKLQTLIHILKWRMGWNRYDIDLLPKSDPNGRFITARAAAKMIPPESTVTSAGMLGNHGCSIFFKAVRQVFDETGAPSNLTWISVCPQGGKGKIPGTVEELAVNGLLKRYITSHHLSIPKILELGKNKQCEVHVIPLGMGSLVMREQGEEGGNGSIQSHVGAYSFIDPRLGGGSFLYGPEPEEQFVTPVNEHDLEFHLPPVDIAFFIAPYADEEGNIYFKDATTISDAREVSAAARKNGGKVFASVSGIIPKDDKQIFMTAEEVDYLVYNPRNEQIVTIPQKKSWPAFTLESNEDTHEAIEKLIAVNATLGLLPKRSSVDLAVGSMAAELLKSVTEDGDLVNIGTGMPEVVSEVIYENGMADRYQFFTENGVIGGIPAPGIFFGAAVNPEKSISIAETFTMVNENLKATVLGMLEVDSDGNVNVTRKGPNPKDFIGPGGFIDLSYNAKNVIFIGSWMANAKYEIQNKALKITMPGQPKMALSIREISFHAKTALEKGANIFYVTTVGVFQLTKQGVCLLKVMPGIDIQKDILDTTEMKIILPENGKVEVINPRIFDQVA